MVIYIGNPGNQSDSDGSLSSGETVAPHGQRVPVRCQWEMCGYWFSHLEVLAAHVAHVHAVAGVEGMFYCGWEGCTRRDRGFNARYKMLVHVRTHTNERPHLCFKCNKSFSRAENLKIHSRTHTGEKPYICNIAGCGKAYSNSSDRFKHMRTHSVGKPYACKVPGCPKKYTDPSSLRKHLKTFRHLQTASTMTSSTECSRVDVESPVSTLTIQDCPQSVAFQEKNCSYSPELPIFPDWTTRRSPLVRWWAIEDTPTFCSEQDAPLDLTCPIKLPHKIENLPL